MNQPVIITISRQYASGGRDIGRLLAEQLEIPLFDKEIIQLAQARSGLDEGFIEKYGEAVRNKFMLNLQRLSINVPSLRVPSGLNAHHINTLIPAHNPDIRTNEDRLFNVKSSIIKELATKQSCVIVGRCAAWVLQDRPALLSVFIQSEFDHRVRRSIHTYGNPMEGAAENIKQRDRHRANYYKMHTGQKWGHVENYDLVINSSYTGIEGAVEVIKSMIQNKRKF